jgi:CRISPR/Cas system-associated protein endoribonuclease Cas2
LSAQATTILEGKPLARKKDTKKVVKMKRKQGKVTGFFLVLFALYIVILGVLSLTGEHISIYEVTEKKIADDNLVRGVIMRNEKLVNCEQTGYINYYAGDGTKVGAKTKIYSIDETGQIYDQLADVQTDEISLTKQNTNDIRSEIASYRESYDMSHFEETYNFKYNLDNTVSQLTNAQLLDNVTKILKDTGQDSSFCFGTAGESGIVSYTSDGLENLDLNDITPQTFDNTTDNLEQLRKTDSVEQGSAVYRLVTNESWSVVFPLTQEQFKNIQKENSVTITLKKIQTKVSPEVTTFTMEGGYYGKIDLKRYMIQYINNRYIDLEIEMSDEGGLKIPQSSLLKKEYYRVDSDYIVSDQQGNSGVIVLSYDKDGTPEYTHHSADIVTLGEETDTSSQQDDSSKNTSYSYIAADELEKGTQIVKDDLGSDIFELSQTVELDGVYCCNKGYCEFRPVEITYTNDEYCIIRKDTGNGLSVYDHIILDQELIGENDIIH